MSTLSNSKDESFPWITTTDMSKWNVLLRAYLKPKKGDRALDSEKPQVNEDLAQRLMEDGQETRRSVEYRRKVAHRVKLWVNRNDRAYAALVKSATYSPSALTVVLDNAEATARDLYVKLQERFDQREMTGVIQLKLAAFNSMSLASSEKAEDFINRLILAKIDLNNVGCDYVNKDVHCLGRLKEGMVSDERFKDVSLMLSCAPDMTWDHAVRVVTAFENYRTILAKSAKPDTYSSGTGASGKPDDAAAVRRMAEKYKKQVQSLRGKANNYKKKKCNYCGKLGHLEPDCRTKKAARGKSSSGGGESRICYNCGLTGHLAKDCRKRKREDGPSDGGRSRARPTRHVDEDSGDEYNRMLRDGGSGSDDEGEHMVLDSGATSHMLTQSTAAAFKDTDLRASTRVIQTAQAGQRFAASSSCCYCF